MRRLQFIIPCLLLTLMGRSQSTVSMQSDNPLESRVDTIIDNAVQDFIKDTSRVGLSIGLFIDKKTYIYNYGTVKKGYTLLPTANTVYEIGSISKTFTGFLLARAIADKKIKPDDDIRKYLNGQYPNLEYHGQPVSIKHLVSHTSGLPPFLPDRPDIFKRPQDSIPFLLANLHRNYTKEKFLEDLHQVKLDTVPGFQYKYSNTAAQLLAFILEKVYSKNFEELIRQYITAPLGMKQTYTSLTAGHPGFAQGYGPNGAVMPHIPASMKASGGIYSCVSDMLNYIRFQLNEKNEAVRLSHMPAKNFTDSTGIGLFWRINRVEDQGLRIWHTGGTFGFSGYCVLYPEKNTGIILLSNKFDLSAQGELVNIAEELLQYRR